MTAQNPLRHLIAKLRSQCELSQAETEALLSIPFHLRECGENSDILRQGDRPTQCCLVVEGILCRFKMVGDGARQIISVTQFPGTCRIFRVVFYRSDHYLGTLVRSLVALFPHDSLRCVIAAHPRLAGLLWRESLV